ncbi:hypothetical protein CAEBREN_14866 [Caenorhabditis brenneri]|uniref:Uncharacterized protein n=1 Tax=Caenorhabditis brenneri TaxID=135651 RepID=G0NSD8_CAEBE|nr:hypothetical protein CAEBREN_14866 [Caenorhabditis brenneri]
MSAARSSEDVPETSSESEKHSSIRIGPGNWHQHEESKKEKDLEDQQKMDVPDSSTDTMKDLGNVYDPPPIWAFPFKTDSGAQEPPSSYSKDVPDFPKYNEDLGSYYNLPPHPIWDFHKERDSAAQESSSSYSKISSGSMLEVNMLRQTTQELKAVLHRMEEPMQQVKNDRFCADRYSICRRLATKVEEKLNTLLCVSERIQSYSDATWKEAAKKYWKYIAKVKSYSDELLLALKQNDPVQSVNCYNQIVKEICYGEIIDELFNVMESLDQKKIENDRIVHEAVSKLIEARKKLEDIVMGLKHTMEWSCRKGEINKTERGASTTIENNLMAAQQLLHVIKESTFAITSNKMEFSNIAQRILNLTLKVGESRNRFFAALCEEPLCSNRNIFETFVEDVKFLNSLIDEIAKLQNPLYKNEPSGNNAIHSDEWLDDAFMERKKALPVEQSDSKSEPKIGSSELDISSKILAQFCVKVKNSIKTHFMRATDQGGYVLHHFISIESELLKFQKYSAWVIKDLESPVIEDSDTSDKDRIVQKSKRAIAFHKSNLLSILSDIRKSIRNFKVIFDEEENAIQTVRLFLPPLAFGVLSARNSYKELRLSQQIQNTAQEEFTKHQCWRILSWMISVLEFLENAIRNEVQAAWNSIERLGHVMAEAQKYEFVTQPQNNEWSAEHPRVFGTLDGNHTSSPNIDECRPSYVTRSATGVERNKNNNSQLKELISTWGSLTGKIYGYLTVMRMALPGLNLEQQQQANLNTSITNLSTTYMPEWWNEFLENIGSSNVTTNPFFFWTMDNDTVRSTSEQSAESSDSKTLVNTPIPRGSISQYNSKLSDEKKSIEQGFERIQINWAMLDKIMMEKKLLDENVEDEELKQMEEEFQKHILEQKRRNEEELKRIIEKTHHEIMLNHEKMEKLFDEMSRKNVHQKNKSDVDEVFVESDHKKVQSNVCNNDPGNSEPQESLRLTEGMFEKMRLRERKGKKKLKHSARELFITERCLEKIRTELLEVLRNRYSTWKLKNSMDNRTAVLFHFTKIENELNNFERRIIQKSLENEEKEGAEDGEKKELKTEKLWKKCDKNLDFHRKNENESIEEAKTMSESFDEILRSALVLWACVLVLQNYQRISSTAATLKNKRVNQEKKYRSVLIINELTELGRKMAVEWGPIQQKVFDYVNSFQHNTIINEKEIEVAMGALDYQKMRDDVLRRKRELIRDLELFGQTEVPDHVIERKNEISVAFELASEKLAETSLMHRELTTLPRDFSLKISQTLLTHISDLQEVSSDILGTLQNPNNDDNLRAQTNNWKEKTSETWSALTDIRIQTYTLQRNQMEQLNGNAIEEIQQFRANMQEYTRRTEDLFADIEQFLGY